MFVRPIFAAFAMLCFLFLSGSLRAGEWDNIVLTNARVVIENWQSYKDQKIILLTFNKSLPVKISEYGDMADVTLDLEVWSKNYQNRSFFARPAVCRYAGNLVRCLAPKPGACRCSLESDRDACYRRCDRERQIHDEQMVPGNLSEVSVKFSKNKRVVASAVYRSPDATLVRSCSPEAALEYWQQKNPDMPDPPPSVAANLPCPDES